MVVFGSSSWLMYRARNDLPVISSSTCCDHDIGLPALPSSHCRAVMTPHRSTLLGTTSLFNRAFISLMRIFLPMNVPHRTRA